MEQKIPIAPRWARAADLVVLALLVVAATIAITGGFRVREWDRLISVRSAGRVLLWAVAVLGVRHLFAPHPSVLARLARGGRSRPKTSAALLALAVVWTGLAIGASRSRNSTPTFRQALFSELQPTRLRNCTLKRFGEPHDGGYLLCDNLLGDVGAGYSYGINGYDGWGCDVSKRLGVVVHQYDCFNLAVPACRAGRTRFHGECVGEGPHTEEGRPFDSVQNQVARNGDEGKHLVLKMDIEGAEWTSLPAVPDALLERIDQIAIEFHGVNDPRALSLVRRLKRFFHVAVLHFNNSSCDPSLAPFTAWAYEALLVNKRLGRVDHAASALSALRLLGPPAPDLLTPNDPRFRDCQPW